ncbi:MAG: Ig-like domain-containing protein [Methylovulum sp.]|nr:Ig-like domain-containing protein [Methylovulum sp.]
MAIKNFSSVAAFKAGRATLGTDTAAVSDSSANLQAVIGSLLNDVKVSQINSADNANINIAIGQLSVNPSSIDKLTADDIITVTGSTADLQTNLSTLLASNKIDVINPNPANAKLTVSVAQESLAANMAKLDVADKIVVSDTSAALQGRLAALFADTKVDVIDSTEPAVAIQLKTAQFVQANTAKLSLNDMITVADKSTTLQTKLTGLLGNGKIDNIDSTTPAAAINLTATQALVATNIAKFNAADKVNVVLTAADASLTAEQLTTLRTDPRIDNVINTYSLVSDVLVDEGSSITFTVSALVPVAVDTKFTYQIQGNTANPASASDIAPAAGSVIMLAGHSTANITINALDEGVREFNEGGVFILSNSTGATQIATQAFLIQDGASYTLSPTAASANEGTNATFTLVANNVADDTVVTYTLSGVTADDVVGGSLTGSATVSGGVATITVPLAADLKTEAVAETLKVAVDKTTVSATMLINDTSKDATFAFVSTPATVDEGTSATFTLNTNAADGSVVSYALSGVTAADVTDGLLAGQTTVTGGVATITVPLALDATTDAGETLTVTETSSGVTASTLIIDKSFTPVLAIDSVTGTIDKLSGQGIAIMDASVIAAFTANDTDSTGVRPTGAVTVDTASEVNGELIVLGNGKTGFVADAGQRVGSFQYSVAGIDGVKGTVNVTINSAPVFDSGSTLTIAEDTKDAPGTVKFTDTDGDTLNYAFGKAAHGTVTAGTNGAYTYTPDANFNGTDTFQVQVRDDFILTPVTQDVTVTVTSVNDDPQLISPAPAATAVKSGQSATVDLSTYATDPDAGDAVTFALAGATTAHGGTVTLGLDGKTATVSYPQAGGSAALGADTFNFTVTDGKIVTPIAATVNLDVTNTAPTASAIALTAKTGVTQTIDLVALGAVSDAEGNTLAPTITKGSLTSGGSAEVSSSKIVYTSTIGFVGTETLKYSVTDGFGGTSTEQMITFTVTANTGGTSGDDLLYGSSAAENIDGLAGNDSINGGGGADTMIGGEGNDLIVFNDNAKQILAGSGIDTLVVNADAAAAKFDLSSTTDQVTDLLNTVIVVRGIENIDASKSGSDVTIDAAAAGTTSILLGNGNDTITTMALATGTVDVVANSGNDSITTGASAAKFNIQGNDGNDTVVLTGATNSGNSVFGGAGNDTITVTTTKAYVDGGDDKDTVTGSGGDDTLLGGNGDDSIVAGAGIDSILGGDGNDTIDMAGNLLTTDFVDGGTGTNTLVITTPVATVADLSGVSNITVLKTSADVTLAANKAGLTTVDFTDAGDQDLILNAGYTAATTVVLTGDLTNADSVTNTANVALTVVGNVADFDATTTITGGTGADVVQMKADAGTATITLFTKVDTITVGAGTVGTETATIVMPATDTVIATGATLTVNASALTNTAAVFTFTGNAAETDGFLNITGGAGNDVITGDAAADTINGGAGNDTIDTLNGNNVVDAGDGNDTVTAGTGADKLTGGIGDDRFVLAANLTAADTVDGGTGTNVLQVSTAVASAAVLGGVTNVGTLEVDGATAVTLAANVAPTTFDFADAGDEVLTLNAGYTAATTVVLTGDVTTNADSVINTANAALTVVGNVADFDATTTITGGTGADVVQMKADSGTATITAFTKVDTITVGAGTVGTETATIVMPATDTVIANGATLVVNATALTNAAAVFTFTGNAAETDGKLSITGGAGNDVITGNNGADTILGGSGADAISGLAGLDILTGGLGNDTFGVSASTNGNIFSTITDATAGDILSFTNLGTETFAATKLSLGSTAVFQDYLNFAAAGNGSVNAAISWFQFSGNTYAVEDLSAGASFVNGTDLVVSLTGLVDLSTATGAGTNALTLV